jgi:hypothetical protein
VVHEIHILVKGLRVAPTAAQ